MFRSSQSVIAAMVVVFVVATGTLFFHRLKRKVEPKAAAIATLAGDPWWIDKEAIVIIRPGDSLWSLWKGLKIKQSWSEWLDDTLRSNPGVQAKKLRPGSRLKFVDKGEWPLDM